MHILVFFLALCLSTPAHSQIKRVSVYPTGISVPWTAEPPPFAEEEIQKKEDKPQKKEDKPKKKLSRKEKKLAAQLPPPPPPPAAEPVAAAPSNTLAVTRLVRVVSALNLKETESLALVFYDSAKKHLKKFNMAVTNTPRPSALNAFFMDKSVYNGFKGLLDTYFFPPNAVYMNVAIVDKKGGITSVPAHPSYDADKLLSIEEFEALEKGRRMMLQFEIRGDGEKNFLRLGIFRFR